MKHSRESGHGHMQELLIMIGFHLELVMNSFFCCQCCNCKGNLGRALKPL